MEEIKEMISKEIVEKYIQRNIDMSLWKEINPANQINYEKWEISRDIKTLINNLDK
jgi:hypothetical protein